MTGSVSCRPMSSTLISLLGFTNALGRFGVGWMADRDNVNPVLMFALGCFGSALCCLCYPFCPLYVVMAAVAALHGLFIASYKVTVTLSALELFGLTRVNFANGMFQFFFGIGVFAVPSTIGHIFDLIGRNYFPAMAILSALIGTASILSFACYLSHKFL